MVHIPFAHGQTEDIEKLTGGKIALGDDPVEVADGIEKHIMGKRTQLGLK